MPRLLNRVTFVLNIRSKAWFNIGRDDYAYRSISPTVRDCWGEDLRRFLILDRTAAWSEITAELRSCPNLPINPYSYFVHKIWEQGRDAAWKAVILGHERLFFAVSLTIKTDYTDGAVGEWAETEVAYGIMDVLEEEDYIHEDDMEEEEKAVRGMTQGGHR